MTESNRRLYAALMGKQKTVDEALTEASKRIAAIGRRNTAIVRRTVRKNGMSSTKLYDVETSSS